MTALAATQRFELDGGTVAYLEESHAIPLVSIVVAFRNGSGADPAGKEGLARLSMRMLRRGTAKMSARQIEEAIDALGAEMAVDTSVSSIAIHAQVIGRNVEAFVDLLAHLLSASTFPADELARLQRESIAEIIEARDNDRSLAQKAFQRVLFAGHPYGRNAAGTTASLERVKREDAIGFASRHLVRSEVVMGFAGDVTPAQASALAQRIVAGLPKGAAGDVAVAPPEPIRGRKLVFVDKPERSQTQILVGGLGTWPHDPDHVPLSVANAVFGGTFTSRLMQEVRSKRGWSYGASARLTIDRQRQAFAMWTFPGAADAAPCLALELDLLDAFVKDGITKDENDFIKQYLVRSHAFDIDTATKRLHQALDIELLGLPADYYSSWVDRVKAVTPDAANAAVEARIKAEDLLIVVVGTAAEIAEPVRAAIPRLAVHEIVPFDAE